MANVQNHVISNISDGIYGVAGYYSENDSTQHVVVATTDGTLYEIHWNQHTGPTSPQLLLRSPGSALVQFNGIHSLCGFFTSDDNFQHVIIFTEDGRLHELYFTNPQQVHVRSPLLQLPITAGAYVGMGGFYNSVDRVRDVTVGGADNILRGVEWNAQLAPNTNTIATQFTLSDVAGIASFFDHSVHPGAVKFIYLNTIVAMKGGDVYNVHLDSTDPGGGEIRTDLVTTFSPPLVNAAAFIDTDTHRRHVIVLHANGQLYDYSYTPEQVLGQTPLVSIANIVDIVAYYSAYDTTGHVIAATSDGNIHEVYYS